VRAGLIVGPHDPTGRFTYWPHRVARGGDVLVPGPAWRPVQLVDVRDLAAWIVTAAEERLSGPFNATGPATMGAVLDAARRASGSTARAVEVDDAFLTGQGVGEWMELPLWIDPSNDDWRHFMEVDATRATAAGLTFRPLDETVAGALAEAANNCATCGNAFRTSNDIRDNVVYPILIASHLDPAQVQNFNVQRDVVLNPGSPIIEHGAVVSLDYPYNFKLNGITCCPPRLSPILQNLTVRAQAQARQEE